MSGAHGEVAIASTAPGRRAFASGSAFNFPADGIGGGPSGRPFVTDFRPMSVFGFTAIALLPLFSRAPCSIHVRSTVIWLSGIFCPFGGIFGSALCVVSVYSRDLFGSPATTTSPDPPPCIMAANVAALRPPFCLSLPWQLTQCCLRIGSTSSSNVGFAPSANAGAASEVRANKVKVERSILSNPRCQSQRRKSAKPTHGRGWAYARQWLNMNSREFITAQNTSSNAIRGSLPFLIIASRFNRSSSVGGRLRLRR
ncbi:hypothetical protein PX52LOC_00058 [Limnoglobus roseus]|uniref:Uncharacterized protein n=1 Tax=Limnoglobus roseus TaxID=2598579 RepID=A0A5C1A4B7_9BACT|nr:hypothetical protein PX52LOC_00058 [Limnoglobus roseus]